MDFEYDVLWTRFTKIGGILIENIEKIQDKEKHQNNLTNKALSTWEAFVVSKLQLADENGVVHLHQDRPSASTNLPRQKKIRASAEMTKIKASWMFTSTGATFSGQITIENLGTCWF